MSGMFDQPTPREERMAIIKGVAKRHGITVKQIMGRSTYTEIVEARHHAMRIIHAVYGDSSTRIGRLFNRDHTTVLAALGRIAKRRVAA